MDMEPKFQVLNLIYGFHNSMTLKCALQLGIPDIIKKHAQPMSLTEIINALPGHVIDPDRMYRLMRFLVHNNVFTCTKENWSGNLKYGLTPQSELLVTDNGEKSLATFALFAMHPIPVDSLQHLIEGLDSSITTWMHGQKFATYEEMVAKCPEFQEFGDKAMTSYTNQVVEALVRSSVHEGVFDSAHSVVDLGGGNGTAAKAIVEAFPEIKCTVVDMPVVINGPQFTHPRIKYEAGDAFSFVPKADVIFAKSFLHNYPNEECIKILKKCKEAIPPKTGKIVLLEVVIDEKGSSKNLLSKLHMDIDQMMTGGKERSRKNWEDTLGKAGFNNHRFINIDALESIIEAYP